MSDSKHVVEERFNEKGQRVSPSLPGNAKNFLIDIDGTICEDIPNEEPERMITALPYPEALKIINRWYEQGHIITFFTARTEELRELTEAWLSRHNINYHYLLMNKPRGGSYHWIDSNIVKATRFKGKFIDLVVDNQKVEVVKH